MGLVSGFQARDEQHDLDGDGGEAEEVVARQAEQREMMRQEEQAEEETGEEARPRLLQAENEELPQERTHGRVTSGGCCAPYRSYESHKPYSSSFDLLSIQDGTPVERFADAAEALEQHIQNLIRAEWATAGPGSTSTEKMS